MSRGGATGPTVGPGGRAVGITGAPGGIAAGCGSTSRETGAGGSTDGGMASIDIPSDSGASMGADAGGVGGTIGKGPVAFDLEVSLERPVPKLANEADEGTAARGTGLTSFRKPMMPPSNMALRWFLIVAACCQTTRQMLGRALSH